MKDRLRGLAYVALAALVWVLADSSLKVKAVDCPTVTVSCTYIDSFGQPTLNSIEAVDGGAWAQFSSSSGDYKFRSYYTTYETSSGDGASYSWGNVKWLCQNGHGNDTGVGYCPFSGALFQDWYGTVSPVEVSCGGGGGCSGSCTHTWYNYGGGYGAWVNEGEGCGSGCFCCTPEGTGYQGQQVTTNCQSSTTSCGDPPPGPCDYAGGDADADGCCDATDCDPGNASYCTSCPPPNCDENGGDTDEDGCCDDVDCYTEDPERCECDEECEEGEDADEDGCCDDEDYDNTDPDVCEEEDSTECGRCRWQKSPIEGDYEEGEIPPQYWEKTRDCKDEDECSCNEPEEDPDDTEVDRVLYTDCDPDCECDFNWETKYNELKAKIEGWWPSLDLTFSGADSATIVIHMLYVTQDITLNIPYNPANWEYGAPMGETLRDWLRAFITMCLAYTFFMCVIRDIQSL